MRRSDEGGTRWPEIATTANKPAWVELMSSDAAASREFYTNLFGWQAEVSPDPAYGGYAVARIGGKDVAGIGQKQSPDAPTAWGLYIGTTDADALAKAVSDAGGSVVVPPFDVGDQGRMVGFQDPSGAFIAGWQSNAMQGFGTDEPNAFGWAELNARGVATAIPFYEKVFGWTHRESEMGEGLPPYTELLLDGEPVAGAWEVDASVPADVPSYWTVYFQVTDVDAAFGRAIELGASEVVGPQDFPGGRFALVTDPQGATFGLIRV